MNSKLLLSIAAIIGAAVAAGTGPHGAPLCNGCTITGTGGDNNANAKSGCDGGEAFMCTDQQPWAVSDTLSYGFAAASISGGSEASWCCACYKLTFTSTSIAGKQMIVQVTNTGGDLGENHFDLQMPGGGLGIFDGCSTQFNTNAASWGERYGGLRSADGCANLPASLQKGCQWRFDWFENADNPAMEFEEVECPAELTAKTGCKRL
ncbi:glycoside hydrolase [Neocallimastix californiae]|uniref:cellulase n=1 Tax=Neocallimastix californiae TaxID=1754190 RepID=A0A1Y2ELU4_9FUNG|nr:glycoside hydrolase [Neocallimastix californiae]|eukprot:ORY72502.1 glycoside hydrolase [Neocallimastix californiae]